MTSSRMRRTRLRQSDARDIDEWIDVDVRVARMTEDHAADSVARETLANAAHVFGESRSAVRHRPR